MTSLLLFDDSPLVVSPDLASLLKEVSPKLNPCYGAIVLQQVHYGIKKESGKIARDGLRYIFNTYKQWQERLSWLSVWQLRQVFYHLREAGLLIFKQLDVKKWNRRGYYTIDYQRLEALRLSKCGTSTHRSVDVPHFDVWDSHTSINTQISSEESTHTCEVNSFEEENKRATKEEETIENKPTSEEIDQVERELRKLRINGQEVAMALRKHWKNAANALEQVKAETNEGWVKKPIARFLKHLTDPSIGSSSAAAAAPQKKEYPKPTPDQLIQLEKLGRLTQIVFDEPGYPEVVAVESGKTILPWYVVLGLKPQEVVF